MKSYLSLIPISAKVRKQQNRMTVLCIIIAVFLVTAIFSVADMMIRTESDFMINNHGNWHIAIKNISQDDADEISNRSDVTAVGAASQFNFEGEQPYRINKKRTVLYGTDEAYIVQISNGIVEGTFPENDTEVMLTPNAVTALGVQIGDKVTLHTPAGDRIFTISGFGTDDENYYNNQTYLVGSYLTQNAFTSVMAQNEVTNNELTYYVQFESATKAANAKRELQTQYQLPDESISENTGVMGMSGQSNSTAMQSIYGLAAILFVLVLLAGILMISGSMNSMIAQRTQFFGMLRCIGASHVQIIRFVRLEALNWCKIAVPIGVFFGTIISWIICATLHYGIGGEFSTTPVFQISPVGLISGVVVGVVTVFLAAQSPAKRAAKVSPISAVSGNIDNKVSANHAIKFNLGKIDNSLGFHHAIEKKKNWFLMTASFALTIMLFFSFSVILDFAKQLVPSQNVTSADIALSSYANKLDIERSLVDEIKKIDGVANAYGSSYMENIPATSSRAGIDHINIVSYDDTLLDYSKESIAQGALDTVYGDSNKVATVYNGNNSLRIGDTIQFAGEEVEIACTLSQGLFGDDLIIICSQETFDRIMGNTKYGLIGIQLDSNATEETIAEIRSLENDDIIITDQRESNKQNNATYLAVRIVCYGFLAIVGIISLFNIVNSISMSVSARMKQYGAMRAVGMDNRQLKRMISAEAYTYAISGLIVGCGIGLPLSRFLYNRLIAHYFGIEWSFPILWFGIVVAFIFISAIVSVYAPAKRIRNMAITETINEW
ncbi:FtsX-like permease family protein [Blautia sp. MSK17_66]|uniref:ABC transporter permease n=1 Tax=Blautia TaxID=572511 RepID=UPI00156FECAA|nr:MULTISPECIES: FtsX-like permease family protein [Blautia]MCB5548781.1 FtsX-like permease family protein [Blautia sp. MSK17_66]NSK02838.1 FtsX-like permease family protein [Blautia obeum]